MRRPVELLPKVAGGLLIGYVLLLLGLTHFEQVARMESDAEQIRLGLEKRATALSYFYSVRRDDLNTLGNHRSVTTFFANRDLGMSMQYGLGASLLKMRQAFEQLVEHRRIAGDPVYLRILLREPNGSILLDTHSQQELDLASDLRLDPDAIRILPQVTALATRVLLTAPLRYKGRFMGHMLAWVNQDLAQRHLIAADAYNSGSRILLHITGTPVPATIALPVLDKEQAESKGVGVWLLPGGGITARIPVTDTPFEVIGSFPPNGISAILPSHWFTVSLLILAAMILIGVWIAVRMHTHNLVLCARIEESAHHEEFLKHKNQELELEIVQRKESERELIQARHDAETASRTKSEFLAMMSHEIRTPMNGVLGMTELLLESGLTDKQCRFAETAFRSGQMLLDIINNILDFSKIEANKLRLAQSPFDLQEVVEDVLQMVAEQARKKHLELLSDIQAGLNTKVIGDGPRLNQVLVNLVGNAVKFTQQGEIMIRVTPEEENSDGILILFEVQDSGIGIDEDKLEGIFSAFTQADGSVTRRYGGTGLGLAISKQLVTLMGGEMGVESKKGIGSRFHFTARLGKQTQVEGPVASSLEPFKGTKVLVVDDNKPTRSLLVKKIRDWGLQATGADCGNEALMLLQDAIADGKPYALSILDRMMPGMDGITLARKIKADTTTADIRLLMYSALHEEVGDTVWQKAGIEAYLSKPARFTELRDQLLSLLGDNLSKMDEVEMLLTETVEAIETSQYGCRILLVEDNEVNQEVALAMLEMFGNRIDVAENGQAAVEYIKVNSYDLILMDCHMPEMDGFAATKAIRDQESEGGHVPIIALTADVQKETQEQCLAAGMDDYLSKPFSQEALQAVLERWLTAKDKEIESPPRHSTAFMNASQVAPYR